MERVRFAPSPTGPLHIGGVRTALFNYLYSKNKGGVFVLRVEDTDQNRYVQGAEEYIIESLKWLGVDIDEGPVRGGAFGPYRQSERKKIYQKYIQKLIALGGAYYAFDSVEELQRYRNQTEKEGVVFRYGKHNRLKFRNSLSLKEEETKLLVEKGNFVVRLKNDTDSAIRVQDLLRGEIVVAAEEMDDKILIKADGMPTYHFANVVDDYLMNITTVIRGEEWLPSLPLHYVIYDRFSWTPPQFIHLPLILKPEGKGKLSKRDGDKGRFPVFPMRWGDTLGFKEHGYTKEGLVNYLALLGWNPGSEKEIFTKEELIAHFGLSGIQKGGARFDISKAQWVNCQHIQQLSVENIAKRVGLEFDERILARISLIKDRATTLVNLTKMLNWFEVDPSEYAGKALNKLDRSSCKKLLSGVREVLGHREYLEKEDYLTLLNHHDVKLGMGMQCLRLALFGELVGPDLFQFMKLVDKNVLLKRITFFEKHLNTKT
ncbi:MAG: glutamate--tRNA ligase [Flavobacteriaceae bacterium]